MLNQDFDDWPWPDKVKIEVKIPEKWEYKEWEESGPKKFCEIHMKVGHSPKTTIKILTLRTTMLEWTQWTLVLELNGWTGINATTILIGSTYPEEITQIIALR